MRLSIWRGHSYNSSMDIAPSFSFHFDFSIPNCFALQMLSFPANDEGLTGEMSSTLAPSATRYIHHGDDGDEVGSCVHLRVSFIYFGIGLTQTRVIERDRICGNP